MIAMSLMVLCLAFCLRALWSSKKRATAAGRALSGWRCFGWLALSVLLGLALRPRWPDEGWSGFTLLPCLILSMWIVLDPSVRRGGRGTLGRTFFGMCVLLSSFFALGWFRLGPAMADQPLLVLHLTGQKSLETVSWQMPGQPSRSESMPTLLVEISTPGSLGATPGSARQLHIVGDVLSVRAQRIRLWWPLEFLGFPPVIWLDAVRGEYLDPTASKDFPVQVFALQQPATLLGSSLQAWCSLVWQKAFRSGSPSWWMESAQLESAGISLVGPDGTPLKGAVEVWANGASMELRRQVDPPTEKSWEQRVRSWCPDAICGSGQSEPASGTPAEQAAPAHDSSASQRS
jgi:hypothetical protein